MNETSPIPSCSRCGAPLSSSALKGLCPRCLMALNLAAATEIPGETGPPGTKTIKPPPAPDEIAKHFPQFEILECLGRGGMGVVYKARQPKLNRIVALKILAPEKVAEPKFAERFEREAQALARLNHPNIVTVYDFGEADGLYYLTMEFVDGVSLRQLLQTRKITPEEALAIVPKICEALQFAHEQGVVHRDIKPENVLLDKQGRVKIADFGIAKIVSGRDTTPGGQDDPPSTLAPSAGESGAGLTQDQVLGTPHYMAPEQREHPETVDHRADIYSLGVVFYELLTGELPLGKFQPPSQRVHIDVRLDEVVLRALEKQPERRYQQASEVKTQLHAIAGTPDPSSNPGEQAHPEPSLLQNRQLGIKPRCSRTAIVAAVWIGLTCLLALVVWLVVRPRTARTVTLDKSLTSANKTNTAPKFSDRLQAVIQRAGGPATNASPVAVQTPAFGPVIERVVNDVNVFNYNVAIRFQTGELLSLPPVDRLGQQMWMLTNGVALLATKETGHWLLFAAGLHLGDFPAELWDKADAAEVAESLLHGTKLTHPEHIELAEVSYLLPEPLNIPFVLSFQTREGATGLLQITGFTDNPRGVKLRYKLVQTGTVLRPESVTPVANEIVADYNATITNLDFVIRRERQLLSEGLKEAHPLVMHARMQIAELSRHKTDLESRNKQVQAAPETTGTPQTPLPAPAVQFRWVAGDSESNSPADLFPNPNNRLGAAKLRVLKEVWLDGSAVAQAGWQTVQNGMHHGMHQIVLKWTEPGRRRFAEITAANIGRQMAVVFQSQVLMATVIGSAINAPTLDLLGSWGLEETTRTIGSFQSGQPATQDFRFGQMQEFVLPPLVGPNYVFLNLRDHLWATSHAGSLGSREFHDWMRRTGCDVAAAAESQFPIAICYDMVVVAAGKNAWETATPAQIKLHWVLMTAEAQKEDAVGRMAGKPDTFYFRTRADTWGILQVLGFADNPRGVKIRYKLVQNEDQAVSATSEAGQNANKEIAHLKLQRAEQDVKIATEKVSRGVLTEYELQKVKCSRDIAAAEVKNDDVEVARLKLAIAELDLDMAGKRLSVGKATTQEYEQAKFARDAEMIRYKLVQKPPQSQHKL